MNDPANRDGQRLRVLQVVETLDMGGMERMISTLSQSLNPDEFEVRVLVTKRVGVIGESLQQAGVQVDCAHVRIHPADYFASRQLTPFIRQFKPDVIHTHATHALLYGGLAGRWCKVKRFVHTEHGRVFPDKSHLMLAERWLARNLSRYVTVSDELADSVHQFQRIPRERIEAIPNGVFDLSAVTQEQVQVLRERLLPERGGPVVGLAARLVPEKGLDILLHAWAHYSRLSTAQEREAGTLLIVGEGPERARLEQLIVSLGISDSVRMPGALADTAAFYRVLSHFVLSSVSEGLPMALLEAMAAGLPVVATRIGGVPAALGNGEAGILVPVCDPISLGNALCQITGQTEGDRRTAERLGAAARQRFLSSFTADAMAARYSALYRAAGALRRTGQ